ncbi:hypothetical protein PN488_06885 [Nodularia spumigena CS-591/12]|uniref:hypothetical protein n=1 Tax=Nodularia spumigena TaxID=70799 RepID=UPI00232E7C58|nr:hypothetical protein [Nodularia spumigena]MDB9304105.1 hypothetical protein [Nodularia spumigena CS-591/12]MDB9350010.1 hypothetical protein [Nodularia spumigena CS-588/01]MDB9351912.1 hypothetical protein [Nodularia spumigena CS-588/05]
MITDNQIKSKVWESKKEYCLTKESLKMLWENRIPLIRIKDFATEQECDILVAQAQLFHFNSYQNVYPKIERIGITVFEYNRISKAAYFQAVERTAKLTGEILINPHLEINLKHIDIRGTWGIDFSHFYRMIELLKRHSNSRKNIAWENLISRAYTLKEINQALADVEHGYVLKAVIQPNY